MSRFYVEVNIVSNNKRYKGGNRHWRLIMITYSCIKTCTIDSSCRSARKTMFANHYKSNSIAKLTVLTIIYHWVSSKLHICWYELLGNISLYSITVRNHYNPLGKSSNPPVPQPRSVFPYCYFMGFFTVWIYKNGLTYPMCLKYPIHQTTLVLSLVSHSGFVVGESWSLSCECLLGFSKISAGLPRIRTFVFAWHAHWTFCEFKQRLPRHERQNNGQVSWSGTCIYLYRYLCRGTLHTL